MKLDLQERKNNVFWPSSDSVCPFKVYILIIILVILYKLG